MKGRIWSFVGFPFIKKLLPHQADHFRLDQVLTLGELVWDSLSPPQPVIF